MMSEELPRLLLISDVQAERSAEGMLLLYRLLSQYPADRLMIVTPPSKSLKTIMRHRREKMPSPFNPWPGVERHRLRGPTA